MQLKDLIIKAIDLYARNQLDDAVKILVKILKKDPKNPDALRVYGDIFLTRKNYLMAIDFYKKSLINYPKQPIVQNNCGVCYLNINDFDRAEFFFDLVLSENPKSEEALFNKGYLYEKLKNFDKSLEFYESLVEVNPKIIDAQYKIISLNIKLENYKYAYKKLHDLFVSFPNGVDSFFYQEKGLCAYKMGFLDEALQDLSIAIDKDPLSAENYNNRGNIYTDLEKYDEAIIDLNKAVVLKPHYSDAYVNFGILYKKTKAFDKAIDSFSKALDIDSKNCKAYINIAILHREKNNYPKALQSINEAINIEESDLAFSTRADIYVALKEHRLAIMDLTKAIELNPYNSDLYCNRGIVFESIEDYASALKDYRAISDRDGNVSLNQKLSEALLHLKTKNFSEGWRSYLIRKEIAKYGLAKINSSKPIWSGEETSKRLYISNEQGVGDQILFTSMLNEVSKRVNKVILSIDYRLEQVYRRSYPDIALILTNPKDAGITRPNVIDESLYDIQLPMGDLGGIFRSHVDDFVNQPNSFLKSDRLKKEKFRSTIQRQNKLVCGISWKSSAAAGDVKSLKLEQLNKIFQFETIEFVSLQYGDVSNEIQSFDKLLHLESLDYFNDLDGVFALVDACDFIITTSNVTAHIAGSMGKETYLLRLYDSRLWYWHECNGNCLWYPTIKIIFQKNPIFDTQELEEIIKRKSL